MAKIGDLLKADLTFHIHWVHLFPSPFLPFQTPNSYFIYTLEDPSGRFALDRHSGVLRLARPLDREEAASMRLTIATAELEKSLLVEGEERPPGAAVTVNVVVRDANDNAPVFVPREY